MMFNEIIKQLREECQLPLRTLAAALHIDTSTYFRIENGMQGAKREQITVIAKLLQINESELVTLWLADKFIATIGTETELAPKAFEIALQKAKKNKNNKNI
ncbi:MAG: helix-turn-helix domain-containing protein [Bacteroidales bacterium]|nr:helix-turn-helix domain-containing protein [Bacteroidales bacterium]